MHLALWYVVRVCHQDDVKKIYWQCASWWVWLSERRRTLVFRKLCPVSFLVVGESPSVLLYVNCGDDG